MNCNCDKLITDLREKIKRLNTKIEAQVDHIKTVTDSVKVRNINLDRVSSERDFIQKRIVNKYGIQAWLDINMSVDNPRNFDKDQYAAYVKKRAIEDNEIRKIRLELSVYNDQNAVE